MQVDHKEGIRLLTGAYEFEYRFPEKLQNQLQQLCFKCDAFAMHFMRYTCKTLFGYETPGDLSVHADLPVAYAMHANLVDIAHYFNEKGGGELVPPMMGESTEEVNCVPHIDPGLISLSFLSTAEGLQLLDPEKDTWVSGPQSWRKSQRGLGVIWLGKAAEVATDGRFRAGVHRVIYPKKKKERTTIWFETCTVAQINGPSDKPLPKGKFLLPSLRGPGAFIPVEEGDDRRKVLYRIERVRGVPTSKSQLLDDEFKAPYDNEIYGLQAMIRRDAEERAEASKKARRSGCDLQ